MFGERHFDDSSENGTPLTLIGAFIEAISESWNVSISDIIEYNSLDVEQDVEIAIFNGSPVTASATLIKKPIKK